MRQELHFARGSGVYLRHASAPEKLESSEVGELMEIRSPLALAYNN
jgi:hypothetical protein